MFYLKSELWEKLYLLFYQKKQIKSLYHETKINDILLRELVKFKAADKG